MMIACCRQAGQDGNTGGEVDAAERGGADVDRAGRRRRVADHQLRGGVPRGDGVPLAAGDRGRRRAGHEARGARSGRRQRVQVPRGGAEPRRARAVLGVRRPGQGHRTRRYVAPAVAYSSSQSVGKYYYY